MDKARLFGKGSSDPFVTFAVPGQSGKSKKRGAKPHKSSVKKRTLSPSESVESKSTNYSSTGV